MIDSIVDLVIRYRNILLVGGIVTIGVCAFAARDLDFDRSVQNMFAADDQFLKPYHELTEVFGSSEAVLLVYEDPHLLAADGSGIDRAGALADKITQIDGVSEVLSLATIDQILVDSIDVRVTSDEIPAPAYRELFQNLTHSSDGRTAAIVCMLESREKSGISRRVILTKIRDQIDALDDDHPEVLITGEPVMVADGFQLVEDDGRLLNRVSIVLLSLVILACFRSLRWVLIAVVIVQFALLSTQAILVWSGVPLSMVSSMFSAIVTVIGVATVVHVIVRFREGRALKLDMRSSLRRSLRRLIGPITWACLTDAAGFAALMFATVGPVQDFGLMMAIGSVMVLVAVITMLPGMALAPLPGWLRFLDIEPQRVWNEQWIELALARPLNWITKYPAVVSTVVLLLGLVGSIGVMRAEVESDFTRNFRPDSEMVTSYKFVEAKMGGAGVWDIMIPAPERMTWDYVKRVDRLERRLREEVVVEIDGDERPGITKALSLSDAINAAPGDIDALPFGQDLAVQLAFGELKRRMPTLMNSLYASHPNDSSRWYFRVMLRSRERQTVREKKQIIRSVERICREEFPPTDQGETPKVSGFFVLLAHLVDSILNDQWKTFGIASALIALMMWLAFRHPFLALAGMAPNLLTIFVVLGSLGWFGIRINMGAAMIAAVSIGLSIDSSIHYITGFRRSRREGLSVPEALASVQQRVGRALVFSTLALIAGFAVLCLSEFVPTIYFGALVSISMLGGLIGNLLILPLLLSMFSGRALPAEQKANPSSSDDE